MLVALALQQEQPYQSLRSGEEYAALVQRVLVVEGNAGESSGGFRRRSIHKPDRTGRRVEREEMKIAAAKAALIATVLASDASPQINEFRYNPEKIANLKEMHFEEGYVVIGRLKTAPEAMWLWSETLRLRGIRS